MAVPCSFDIAEALREIARRVRYLPGPSHRDPEAFHINRSELAHEIDLVAQAVWPWPSVTRNAPPPVLRKP